MEKDPTPKEVAVALAKQVSLKIYQPKGKTIYEQYRDLGKYFGEEIRSSAVKWFEWLKEDQLLSGEAAIADRIIMALTQFSGLGKEYLGVLGAWAEGAELAEVAKLYGLDALEAAMMMQNDDAGCQTVMIRVNDGIALLHTEEDDNGPITERVSKAFLAEIDGSVTFLYNDLLPGGSAFAVDVKRGFAMACDVLRLRTKERGVCLAKIIGWMVWRLGNQATPRKLEELVAALSPLVDGYAINVVYRDSGGKPRAYRASIAGRACYIDKLVGEPGGAIKQVNLLDPRVAEANDELRILSLSEAEINEDLDPQNRSGGYYGGYLDRLKWMEGLLRELKKYFRQNWSTISPKEIHSRIMEVFGIGAKEAGFDEVGKWNPSNPTVGATMSVFVGSKGASAGINLGPSLGRGKPSILLQ